MYVVGMGGGGTPIGAPLLFSRAQQSGIRPELPAVLKFIPCCCACCLPHTYITTCLLTLETVNSDSCQTVLLVARCTILNKLCEDKRYDT